MSCRVTSSHVIGTARGLLSLISVVEKSPLHESLTRVVDSCRVKLVRLLGAFGDHVFSRNIMLCPVRFSRHVIDKSRWLLSLICVVDKSR